MEEQIRDAWGSMVLKNVVRETDEVGKGQIRMRTVLNKLLINVLLLEHGEMHFQFGNLSVMKSSIA